MPRSQFAPAVVMARSSRLPRMKLYWKAQFVFRQLVSAMFQILLLRISYFSLPWRQSTFQQSTHDGYNGEHSEPFASASSSQTISPSTISDIRIDENKAFARSAIANIIST